MTDITQKKLKDHLDLLFELRHDLTNYLEKHYKAKIMGSGITIDIPPVADISFKLDGKEYSLIIKRG